MFYWDFDLHLYTGSNLTWIVEGQTITNIEPVSIQYMYMLLNLNLINDLGKTLSVISAVQTDFCREVGGGGWKTFLNGLGQLFSEYKPLLRH